MLKRVLEGILIIAAGAGLAASAESPLMPVAMQAPPSIERIEYQSKPDVRFLFSYETVGWKADQALQPASVEHQPREGAWWLIVDFGTAKASSLAPLPAGKFVDQSRLPGSQSPRLELRLTSASVQARIDPRNPNVLLLFDPQEFRQALDDSLQSRDWARCQLLLQQAEELGPNSFGYSKGELELKRLECLRGMGLQAFEEGDFLTAAGHLTRYLESRSDLHASLILARAHIMEENYARSRQLLEQLKRMWPTNPEISYYLGIVYMQQSRHQEAIRHFEWTAEALEVQGSQAQVDPKLYCFLGQSYFDKQLAESLPDPEAVRHLQFSKDYLSRFLKIRGIEEQDRLLAAKTLDEVNLRLGRLNPAHADAAPDRPVQPADEARMAQRTLHLEPPFEELERLKGSVVLVHFWATWCSPCLREMPQLKHFYKIDYPTLEKQGLRFITVSNDYKQTEFLNYARENDLPFPIYFDSLQQLQEKLGLQKKLPRTILLDRNGQVAVDREGVVDWSSQDVLNTIRQRLGEGAGSPTEKE